MFRISMLAIALTACAPTLAANQSFLVPEELKLAPNGYASLKSTGESFDLGPIKKEETRVSQVEVIKIHGTFVLVGDGFHKVWTLWPGGKDELHYQPAKLEPGPQGFAQPTLEISGNCALLKWQKGASPAQAYVNADGAANEKSCPQ
jgi:hypothetical protein